MNKKDLIKSVIAGENNGKIPYTMWSHMPDVDREPEAITQRTYDFYKTYDVDIIKTMNNGMYSVEDFGCKIDYSEIPHGGVAKIIESPVNVGEDWEKIKEVSIEKGALKREQEYLELLLKKLNGEQVPVVFTVFSPITTVNKLCGGKVVEYIEAGYSPDIHKALDAITSTTCKLVERVIKMGADGIFFATQMSSHVVCDDEFYAEYGVPYDKMILDTSKGWCNVLHAHGNDIMFDLLKDYPVQIFNYHAWQTLPTIEEAALFTGKTLMCGIERMDITNHHKNALRHEIFETIKATNGKHIILAPGCVIRYPLDDDMLAYIKKVKLEVEAVLLNK